VQINKKSKLLKSLCPESMPLFLLSMTRLKRAFMPRSKYFISVDVILDSTTDILI
jgi:hypothetical protein